MHLPIINYAELNDGELKQLATTAALDVVFANAEIAARKLRAAGEAVFDTFGWPLLFCSIGIDRVVGVATSRWFGGHHGQ